MKHMWDVYTNNPRIGLGGFWREAFVAAYEVLTSEEGEDRDIAISEIARMSIRQLPFLHSSNSLVSCSVRLYLINYFFGKCCFILVNLS